MFHCLFFGFYCAGGGAHVQQSLGQGADGVEIHGVVGAGAANFIITSRESCIFRMSRVTVPRCSPSSWESSREVIGFSRMAFIISIRAGLPSRRGGVLPILQLGHGNARLGLDVDANAEAGQISFLIYQSGGEIWEEEEEGGGGAVQGVVGLNQHISLQEPR